eukprot:scaffold54889_cov44-Phaeocystis_antarctica.AAC.3
MVRVRAEPVEHLAGLVLLRERGEGGGGLGLPITSCCTASVPTASTSSRAWKPPTLKTGRHAPRATCASVSERCCLTSTLELESSSVVSGATAPARCTAAAAAASSAATTPSA